MRPDEESQGPVVRDHRRIDPATGQVRNSGEALSQQGPAASGGPSRPGRHSVARPGGPGAQSMAGGATRGGAASPASAPAGAAPGGRAPRQPAPGEQAAATGPASGGDESRAEQEAALQQAEAAAAEANAKLAERTADLQRLQAEYANYRKRVERDRLAVREQALANVLNELVPVLDDIGRAREHGELVGGFKSVGESLEGIAAKLGLASFGEAGDPFDPMLHEALMHSYSADVTEPTATQILQPGYKVGERIIRPARVAVAEPGGDAAEPESYTAEHGGDTAGLDPDAGRDDAGPDDASRHSGDAGEPGGPPDDTAG
jgi:molecular chaperone GrpE